MALPVHDLAAEVLDLQADARARMLELLIASFDPKSIGQRAWMAHDFRATASTHWHKMGGSWRVGMIKTVFKAMKHHF